MKMDGEIKTLNSRLSSSIHARDAEMKTLAGKRNELAQASAKYKELDELVKNYHQEPMIRFRTVLFLKQPDDGLGPVRLEKKNKNR